MANKTRKSKDDYAVAIPSYKREETLKKKTLAVLKKYGIPASKIYIFVADKEEEERYRNALDRNSYAKIVVGEKGVAPVRNFITGYFPIGKKLLCCDDDISSFLEYDESNKRHERPLRSLQTIIRQGFDACAKHGCRMWGIYATPNGFFMKPTISTDLKFIVGTCFGILNPGLKELTLPISEKDDYYRSLRMYELDGCVVRMNYVAPKTAYYKEPGGMQSDPERKAKQEKAVEYLLKEYPDWVKRNPTRKSGYPEIRIRDSTTRT